MKISILKCPYCGAEINSNTSGKDSIFCPFCGREISVDDCDTKEINKHNEKRLCFGEGRLRPRKEAF